MRGGLLALEFLGDCAFDEGDYEAAYRIMRSLGRRQSHSFPKGTLLASYAAKGRVSSCDGEMVRAALAEARAGVSIVESCVIGSNTRRHAGWRRWLLRNWATFERQNGCFEEGFGIFDELETPYEWRSALGSIWRVAQ